MSARLVQPRLVQTGLGSRKPVPLAYTTPLSSLRLLLPSRLCHMLTRKTEHESPLNGRTESRSWAVGLLCLFVGMLWCTPSHAQQLKPSIQKLDISQITRKTPRRASNNFPYWVSHSDCIADDVITFRVQIQNPSVNNFEVWAGNNDCSQLSQRQGNLAQCWQVYGGQVTRSPASIPIRAQDIVAQNGPKDGTNGRPGKRSDCNNRIYLDIKLFFMYVNDGNEVSSNVVTFDDVGIDLQGPVTPDLERLSPSDDSLIAEWENNDTTMFQGYRLYCADAVAFDDNSSSNSTTSVTTSTVAPTAQVDAAQVDAALVDAALADAAALDDTGGDAAAADDGTTEPEGVRGCGGSVLQQGKYPTSDLWVCGTVDSFSARSGTAKGLRNGRSYAIGVTAIDRLGNESALSNILCQTPREVYTFYEDYRSAGGQGGGGFCTIAAPGTSARSRFAFPSLLLASLALVLAYYRRNSQS